MHIVLAAIVGLGLLALIFLPSIWAKRVIKANALDRPDFPGTGGELARHLLDTLNMQGVIVEAAPKDQDHYDPTDKAVRLSPENLHGRSLTAITVAAHEVGHAIQDRDKDAALANRSRLVRISAVTERLGIGAMVISPLCSAVGGPGLMLLVFLAGLLSVAGQAIVHLVTLPVEWDASFGKAMPILEGGGYLSSDDLPEARRILTACALTYVAASLVGLLNVARWLRVLVR